MKVLPVTDCTRTTISLPTLGRRKIEAEFSDSEITSDDGA